MYTKIIQSGSMVEVFDFTLDPRVRPKSLSERLYDIAYPALRTLRKVKRQRISRETRRIDKLYATRKMFRRIIATNLLLGAPQLHTYTFLDTDDIAAAYRYWRLYAQRLRKAFGKDFTYVCVPEFQLRGTVHFHVLFWGLPNDYADIRDFSRPLRFNGRKIYALKKKGRERYMRTFANIWGAGFVDICLTDGNDKIVTYLAKYMLKALTDRRLTGQKAYVCSRNIQRPTSFNTPSQVDHVREILDLDNAVLERSATFATMWSGQCHYKKYRMKIE